MLVSLYTLCRCLKLSQRNRALLDKNKNWLSNPVLVSLTVSKSKKQRVAIDNAASLRKMHKNVTRAHTQKNWRTGTILKGGYCYGSSSRQGSVQAGVSKTRTLTAKDRLKSKSKTHLTFKQKIKDAAFLLKRVVIRRPKCFSSSWTERSATLLVRKPRFITGKKKRWFLNFDFFVSAFWMSRSYR